MRLRGVLTAVCVSVLAGGGATYCYLRAEALGIEGDWLAARGNAQAQEYAQSLDGVVADAQLKTFEQRRAVLEQAHLWQRGQLLGILVGVLSAICAYILFLLKRLQEQLSDASLEGDAGASPAQARDARASGVAAPLPR